MKIINVKWWEIFFLKTVLKKHNLNRHLKRTYTKTPGKQKKQKLPNGEKCNTKTKIAKISTKFCQKKYPQKTYEKM